MKYWDNMSEEEKSAVLNDFLKSFDVRLNYNDLLFLSHCVDTVKYKLYESEIPF